MSRSSQKGAGANKSKIAPLPFTELAALSSGRRSAWDEPEPEPEPDMDEFRLRFIKLPNDVYDEIAKRVPAKQWIDTKNMLSKIVTLPSSPKYQEFINKIPQLLNAQKKHERDNIYNEIKRFATQEELDPYDRLNAVRRLLNRIDDRKQMADLLMIEAAENPNEFDSEILSYEKRTKPKSLQWIIKILRNPELTMVVKDAILTELEDLYENTRYILEEERGGYDVGEFTKFAFHITKLLKIITKYNYSRIKFRNYIQFLEELQNELHSRLDNTWNLVLSFMRRGEAVNMHPNQWARLSYLHPKFLVSFSIYMCLNTEKEKQFKEFIIKYFHGSGTNYIQIYKYLINLYNETYRESMREFAFIQLIKMVHSARNPIPKYKNIVTIHKFKMSVISEFKEYIDVYYGTRYKENDKYDIDSYINSYKKVLMFLKRNILINTKETDEEEKIQKNKQIDEFIIDFNKNYSMFGKI